MIRKTALTTALFLTLSLIVFSAIFLIRDDVSAPLLITEEAPCPAVGCVSGECHGYEEIPEPDGVSEMHCPEVTCADTECHAWSQLIEGDYNKASDASLNLWVLAPVILTVSLVLIVRKVG